MRIQLFKRWYYLLYTYYTYYTTLLLPLFYYYTYPVPAILASKSNSLYYHCNFRYFYLFFSIRQTARTNTYYITYGVVLRPTPATENNHY